MHTAYAYNICNVADVILDCIQASELPCFEVWEMSEKNERFRWSHPCVED